MAAEKVSRAPVIDVFDRVLDKGIVFDASVRMAVAGIDLIAVEADVIVASIDTYLSSVAMNRVVFIVAADRASLFETMRVANSVGWTHVILDRRRGERRRRTQRVAKDRRQAERRTHDVGRELASTGVAAVVLPPGACDIRRLIRMSRRHGSAFGELPGPTPRSRWQDSTRADERVSGVTSHADVLDRILDKGIVVGRVDTSFRRRP